MKKYCYLLVLGCLCQSCAAQSKARLVDAEQQTVTKENFSYYLYYPEDYEDLEEDDINRENGDNEETGVQKNAVQKEGLQGNGLQENGLQEDGVLEIDNQENKTFPLLLFLHGGGESGDSLVKVKRNGPPKLIARGKKFPFLILAPQNPHKKKWWDTKALMQLLDTIVANNRVDKNRIYLTGLSRGGGAAWEMAVQYPETFAALAVVCGMAPLPYASWIDRDLPIWVFHGDQDESIPVSESDQMVKKLREMGYDVRYTKYKGIGHDSWIQAYETETLYDWLVEQERRSD